jgi:hypothetical protein
VRISDLFGSLTAVWIEWQQANFLINPRYLRRNNIITWRDHSSNIIEEIVYQRHVIDLIDRGQYTFQVNIDGSIIQMYYVFSRDDRLIAANLGYYSLSSDSNVPSGWIRIDYDPSSYRGALHPKCHMHVSLFPNMRFAVDGVPSPKQFVDFIVLNCYPEVFQSVHIDEDGKFKDPKRMNSINVPFLHLDEPEIHQFLTHVRVPIGTVVPS